VERADLVTAGGLAVPEAALTWKFTRSSAPGGQHVNTSSTRVELRCDLAQLRGPAATIDRVRTRLGDEIRIVSAEHRSQYRNRVEAARRLIERLDAASVDEAERRETRPTRASVRARLADKKRRAERKATRRWSSRDAND
jgi:ribosome-associated protein